MRILGMLFAILSIGSIGGCASFQYELVSPEEFRTQVGSDADTIVRIDPLEYRMRTRDNRLVMTVFNPTADTIELLGPRSAVIDPTGRARTISGQAIPPGAFVRMTFPPLRSQSAPSSSRMRMGAGVNVRVDADAPGDRLSEPFWPDSVYDAVDLPVYLMAADNSFWEWRGEGSIRVMLVYQRGETEFQQDFTFSRKRD